MAYSEIDIGVSPFDSTTTCSIDSTYINIGNPANATGVLTSFSIYLKGNTPGIKLGTFSGNGSTSFTYRDHENIGTVSSGGEKTFTGKNCDVSSGDYIGCLTTDSGGYGGIRKSSSDGSNDSYAKADYFSPGTHDDYTLQTSHKIALYATGVTVPDAPTSVSATDNLTDKVTITWTAGTGETGGHRVYRDGEDISGVVAHGTATYDDTTGTAGTTYSYTVKAINDAGLSAASTADNGTRLAASSFIPRIMIF